MTVAQVPDRRLGSPSSQPAASAPQTGTDAVPHVRPVLPNEIPQALGLIFQEPGMLPEDLRDQVHAFLKLARQEQYDLKRQVVLELSRRLRAACCYVPQDGGTAFVFTSLPPHPEASVDLLPYTVYMVRLLMRRALDEGVNLLQILLLPEDRARRDLCLQAGFRHLTDLCYLQCPSDALVRIVEQPSGLTWRRYQSHERELYKKVIALTYQDSLDCPELTDLRTMEQVLRGHQAAGEFDPNYWYILYLDDDPMGVLLTTPIPSARTLELTYMGLCPQARGRKLGKVLLAKAAELTQQGDLLDITLAVDRRNWPALRLYRSFGFETLFPRKVLIHTA